jgi:GNAT superfamily N-acetyltransferase
MNKQPDFRKMARLSTPTLRIANSVADREALIDLNVEHVTWVFAEVEKTHGIGAREILGMAVEDYVPTIIDKVCGDAPPRGVFYLAEDAAGRALGMGGLRWSEDGVAELKRVYVRPEGRGQGLGAIIVERLLADARAFGYRAIRLDTMPFMHSAMALYEGLGFVDCPPYPIEMPPAFRAGIRFMHLTL